MTTPEPPTDEQTPVAVVDQDASERPVPGPDVAGASRDRLVRAGVLIVCAVLSVLVVSPIATNPATTAGIREQLSDQQAAVTAMAGAAAGLSVATDLIPNVDGLPGQLADLSGWFIVIVAAIILQKVLIGVVGYVSFTWILPTACVLGAAYVVARREVLRVLAVKLAIFAVVIFAATPASITVSNLATDTFNDSQEAIAQADALQEAAEDAAAREAEAQRGAASDEPDRGGLLGLLDDARAAAQGAVDAAGDAVGDTFASVDDAKDEAVAWLDGAIQQIALWIITTCVVPLLTIALFGWVIKILFGFEIPVARTARGVAGGVGRTARAGRSAKGS